MQNKLLFTILLLFFGIISVNAQEVELKDDSVLLDGKAILKYEKINFTQYSFYSLEGDEILFYKSFNNETPKYIDDDYYILNFLTAKKKIETKDFGKIASFMDSKKSMQKLIKWLLKEKVLESDGKLNFDKIEAFHEKYNENIVGRTLR
jgi:hypothetical protein